MFVQRTDEPRFGHNSTFPYAHVMILKQTLEAAGVADRAKVADAIRKIDKKKKKKNSTTRAAAWTNGRNSRMARP